MREIREIKEVKEVKNENPTVVDIVNMKMDEWLINDLKSMIDEVVNTTNKGE